MITLTTFTKYWNDKDQVERNKVIENDYIKYGIKQYSNMPLEEEVLKEDFEYTINLMKDLNIKPTHENIYDIIKKFD